MDLTSNLLSTLDTIIKDISDENDVVGLYQDKDHAIELSHKDGVFFVRLDGANLYAGTSGSDATAMFYEQIAQIHDDADRGTDPSFASLREILQARNEHVRDMLAAIGHERLAGSLDGIEMAKSFDFKSFQRIIKDNMTSLDVLNFANYRPSEKENEECHTCIFFAAGGFCTKLDLPVKEEMMCDFFKPLPMAEKNEEWSHVSHQPWEEAEHEEEHDHDMEDVQKDVSRDLLYTEDTLESPANHVSDSRKPNVIMREFIPYGAEDGYQILAQNDDHDGIEIQLTKSRGEWNVFTKQRDYSDMGDPFQSVGEPYQPKKVKLLEGDDKEGMDKLREVRGQDGGEIEKIIPVVAALGALGGAALGAVGQVVGGAAEIGGDAAQQLSDPDESKDDRQPNTDNESKVPRRIKALNDHFRNLNHSEIDEGRVDKAMANEGGLGVDDPEAPNSGIGRHYDRMRDDEENKKSSLAMKAYANDSKDVQKPIDPDEDGREALSSAETGTGTQAFSSGAVIDMPDQNLNSKASGGAGGEGVEGGGDGSVTMIAPGDATEAHPRSDYDSD